MGRIARRDFVRAGVAAGCVAGFGGTLAGDFVAVAGVENVEGTAGVPGAPAPLPVKKGLVMDMLPFRLSYAERFKLARDVGFDVVQAPTTLDMHEAEEIKKAADAANIRIDSVMNVDHWKYPLSSSDAAVVAKSMEGMRTSLHNAKLWGSDAVLFGSGGGQCADFLQGRLDALAGGDSQADSTGC